MNILITGAAGYIGSVITEELIKAGETVIAMDNLQQGHIEAVDPRAIFIKADLADTQALYSIFETYKINAVIHLAAETVVEESIVNPRKYFYTNVTLGTNLLNCMLSHDVSKIVFSSSAAVYGNPSKIPITENFPTIPINPYGETKLIFEKILSWYSKAYNINYVAFRYFNVAGATDQHGEDHSPETHLIPNVIKVALYKHSHVNIFGIDYPTEDGTCIRDYIHVLDIASAHIIAAKMLMVKSLNKSYNLANNQGYSILKIVNIVKNITGIEIPVIYCQRRTGDPPILVASSELAKLELGWEPKYIHIEDIVMDAWKWQLAHPKGYRND